MRFSGGCSVLVARLGVVGDQLLMTIKLQIQKLHSTIIEYKDSWTSSNVVVRQMIMNSIISIN